MADILNHMFISNLKPEDQEYTRREKGGFGVRVYPTGRKTFFYMYRIDGQRRYLNLGEFYDRKKKGEAKGDRVTVQEARDTYDSERAKVKDLKSGRNTGPDPVELKKQMQETRELEKHERRLAPTVADLITEYIERHAKVNKKSWKEDQRCLEKEVLPVWGKLNAKEEKEPCLSGKALCFDVCLTVLLINKTPKKNAQI
jgi:hypothetical protein